MKKYIVDVYVDAKEVRVYDQTASDVAVWILQEKAFSKIVKQSPYYAVKKDERIEGEKAKAVVFAQEVSV
jgi:hypothetical protein